MHETIVNLLITLGIDIAFQEYEGDADEYIIFQIYSEKDSDFFDDTNLSETYYININYWFKSKSNLNKYKEIKKIFKDNDYIFNGAKDLKSKGYFGKNLDFKYINYNLEGEE